MLVLGNGPALKGASLPDVPLGRVIGANRILRTHNVGVIIVVDADVVRQEESAIMDARCLVATAPGLFYSNLALDLYFGSYFPRGRISGWYAAALAAKMAPGGEVVLAGMDLIWRKGEPTHNYTDDGRRYGCSPAPFPAAREHFRELRESDTSVRFSVVGYSKLLDYGFAPFRDRE